MANEKDVAGRSNRDHLAASQEVEVNAFAQKHGVTLIEASELIAEAGGTWVSGSDDYGVASFAQKHGITAQRAREILAESGGDRARADRLARN